MIRCVGSVKTKVSKTITSTFTGVLRGRNLGFGLKAGILKTSGANSHRSLRVRPTTKKTGRAVSTSIILISINQHPYASNLNLGRIKVTVSRGNQIGASPRFGAGVPSVHTVKSMVGKPVLTRGTRSRKVTMTRVVTKNRKRIGCSTVPSIICARPRIT